MQILVGQNHLDTLGGSETFTYTLIKGLKKLGHDVELLVGQPNRLGIMSDKIEDDFKIRANRLTTSYDACFLSHQSSVKSYISYLKGQPLNNVFQIVHGTIPPEEQPVIHNGLKYIAISKEVQNYLKTKYGLDSVYISNFVDLDRFNFKQTRPQLKSCLSLSQSSSFNEILAEICKKKNIIFYSNNKFTNPIFDIENQIYKADLVFSLGRGCYESMACGRNVIVADHRPYQNSYSDGFLTQANYYNFHENNCSGRKMKIPTTEEFLINELEKYDQNYGYELRQVALKSLNMNKNCKLLLKQIQ
jgi:glycosyltransferase involved in cell wall biosynthesis